MRFRIEVKTCLICLFYTNVMFNVAEFINKLIVTVKVKSDNQGT